MTITRGLLTETFYAFAAAYNLKTSATFEAGKGYSNHFIKLDYAPIYGGYRIDIVQPSTGEDFFDGASRRPAKEMYAYIKGLLAAKNSRNFENIINEETV